jgi:hypothetical protein
MLLQLQLWSQPIAREREIECDECLKSKRLWAGEKLIREKYNGVVGRT